MTKNVRLAGFIVFLVLFGQTGAEASTDQATNGITPLTLGGSSEILPGTRLKENTVVGPTMQSSANFAAKGMTELGSGVREIAAGSGTGVVASGEATYKTYANINATLLSKRAAYTRAYAEAESELLQYFKGHVDKCNTGEGTKTLSVDTGTGSAANSSTQSTQQCYDRAAGMLRGFVVFSVKDSRPQRTVTVALASSPKTRASLDRVGTTILRTDNVNSAWNAVRAELQTGVMPPVGARLIVDKKTHARYALGFGSAIILKNPDTAMERHLLSAAKLQAQIRARAALVGFLRGDAVYWNGSFSEKMGESARQFDPSGVRALRSSADAMANIGRKIAGVVAHVENGDYSGAVSAASDAVADHSKPATIPTYRSTQDSFLRTFKSTSAYHVVEGGMVPPGVTTRTFEDDSQTWVVAVSIFSPSAKIAAEHAYRQQQSSSSAGMPDSGIRRAGGVKQSAPNPAGPSGQVTSPGDL